MKSSLWLTFLFWGIFYFSFGVMDSLLADRFGSEGFCFQQKGTHVRVKNCLAENRSAIDCLAEARALCFKDLADEGK